MARLLHAKNVLPLCSIPEHVQTNITHKKSQTMKRHSMALTLSCALFLTFTLTAQSTFIHPGKITVRAGVGIVPTYTGSNAETNTPPLYFQAGYNVSNKFSLNAFAGYSSASTGARFFSDGLATYLTNKSLMTGLRAELRHEWTDRLEMYGGGLIGYNRTFINEYNSATHQPYTRVNTEPTPYNPNAPKGQLLYSGFLGASYFMSKNIGVYGEVGYGISIASVGFTFRL